MLVKNVIRLVIMAVYIFPNNIQEGYSFVVIGVVHISLHKTGNKNW